MRLPDNATKADMAHSGIDWLGVTGHRAITPAVVGGAEMRAAFDDFARNVRIARNAAALRGMRVIVGRELVSRPLPYVPDHIKQTIAVRRKRSHRRGSRVSIGYKVFMWKRTLPSVGHVAAIRNKLIAPGVFGAIEPATRRKFPSCFRWKDLASPGRIGFRITIGDVHHWVVVQTAI
jgi:hypothetical protein